MIIETSLVAMAAVAIIFMLAGRNQDSLKPIRIRSEDQQRPRRRR
ncbi:hypothetical protein [Marinobacterium jannaschii]|nr:hypothetical protein [Marinobacterium jannaschii]